ncbi:MAG: dockerin type I domain-containing protein, partial [candidate division Zixibacteria bacterium]|nr:dockerin type I domain-containing protein [candidate division Zixibacteria bacterium]
QQFVVAVIVIMEAPIPSGRGLAFKAYFNIPASIPNQKVVIDSMFFPPSSVLSFVDNTTNELIIPVLKRGIIIVGDYAPPPVIGVSPDSFYFEGIAGSVPPSPQILRIENLGQGQLRWKASKKSTWLSILPPNGTAPSNVQIYANTSGLPVGIYSDTIVVSDTNATNNPVPVPVRLEVMQPPPTISLSPTSFNFSAVAGSSNPPTQILTVTNTGQGVLHWTAARKSSWLSLNPLSGTDSGAVILSVDITGLTYGFYYDTITVSDTNASNNPQKAVVRLEVASGLPILAVDSEFIFVIVDLGNPYPPDRSFNIFNAGGGSMTFSVSENSPRILSLTPTSGAVPQSVTAGFKTLSGGYNGLNLYDTVTVTSSEATNSPQYVVFQFHYVSVPARIVLNQDSIVSSYYECGDGTGAPPPLPQFGIFNYGTDPMTVNLTWKSSWLKPNHDFTGTPAVISVDFDHKGFVVGTYYDTIVISALNGINSPVKLPVAMHILPTAMVPSIVMSNNDTVFLVAPENRLGKEYFMDVNNANPGCMPWSVQENIGWLFFSIDSSNNHKYPWTVQFSPSAEGLTMGTYIDHCQIVSPTASNSPVNINFKLQVWKLYGDVNYDGILNILDISYLIRYLYKNGPPPIPESRVGDCNCDFRVNVADIGQLIDYLYRNHNPLCGNPYK